MRLCRARPNLSSPSEHSSGLFWKLICRVGKKPDVPGAFSATVELGELYWFLEYKPWTETRENIYNHNDGEPNAAIPFSFLDFI